MKGFKNVFVDELDVGNVYRVTGMDPDSTKVSSEIGTVQEGGYLPGSCLARIGYSGAAYMLTDKEAA